MNYQVNYGAGWENVYPDGYGMHESSCDDEECEGCWSPESGDTEIWFNAIFAQDAEEARAGDEIYTAEEWAALAEKGA